MKGKKASQFNREQQKDTARPEEFRAPASSVSWYTALRVIAALTGGLILRLWMMTAFPQAGGDALIYGNIAANIVHHGQFALSDGSGVVHPTLIRLPGYPFFLAACFRLFGIANYQAVGWLQIALELAACLLLADFVRRIATPRAALNTLWLATMCPFTAVYSSAPLTESLTFDCIALALWSLNLYLHPTPSPTQPRNCHPERSEGPAGAFAFLVCHPRRGSAFVLLTLFTIAISAAALLRPDGALLAIALWPALIFSRRTPHTPSLPASPTQTDPTPFSVPWSLVPGPCLTRAFAVALLSLLPFIAWTIRNYTTFHVFEPLAPRYANDPGEDPHLGWQHWVKTWCFDFTCTSEIYWNVPDSPIDIADLPNWAFDSPAQQQQTAQLFDDYNRAQQQIGPELDRRFQALADRRAADHSIFVHAVMPLGRLTDMLIRPRVENLTIDLRWWQYRMHHAETRFSYAYAAVNLLFLGIGLWGLRYRPTLWPYMAIYFVLRCALLATIEAPETRYTLEFFPMLFILGGITLRQLFHRPPKKLPSLSKPSL